MKTELYKEETQIGGGGLATVEARVAEVERRIRKVVESGVFRLKRGFGYQMSSGPASCTGCAVGALAWSLNCSDVDDVFKYREAALSAELVTRDEIVDLEAGFEGCSPGSMCVTVSISEVYSGFVRLDAPFYELGARLRGLFT